MLQIRRCHLGLVLLFLLIPRSWVASAPDLPKYSIPLQESAIYTARPAYDSGWVLISPGSSHTLVHNLGGDVDAYVVDLQYRASRAYGVNQLFYGGADLGNKNPSTQDHRVGVYWHHLNSATVSLYRRAEDRYAEFARLRIWTDPHPDWDSDWLLLSPAGSPITLPHNLGGNIDDYVIDMQFWGEALGVHQVYYGGNDFGAFVSGRVNQRVGAYWHNLTDKDISVTLRDDVSGVEKVRIRLWRRPSATYDSGWLAVGQNSGWSLSHNIGGDIADYVVALQFRSATYGVHHMAYGGMDLGAFDDEAQQENNQVGAFWYGLDASNISLARRADDAYVAQMRVRIWHTWRPPNSNYDSGWIDLDPDQSETLTHNLAGSVGDYLVDLSYRANTPEPRLLLDRTVDERYPSAFAALTPGLAGSGINQCAFGGADLVTGDRVGAYWYGLDSHVINVLRRADDPYADQARVRIWRMPKPDFDSAWQFIAPGSTLLFTHSLGINPLDYWVDLQAYSDDWGVNQAFYGGADLIGDDRVGVYWHRLNTDSIAVTRRSEDTFADRVRIRIWRVDQPAYDSTWLLPPTAPITLTHALGGEVDRYLVDMTFSNTLGMHTYGFGGIDYGMRATPPYSVGDQVGALWYALNNNNISVYRRSQNDEVSSLRIRIWLTPYRMFLPLVGRLE